MSQCLPSTMTNNNMPTHSGSAKVKPKAGAVACMAQTDSPYKKAL
jgi:hypothetical protein